MIHRAVSRLLSSGRTLAVIACTVAVVVGLTVLGQRQETAAPEPVSPPTSDASPVAPTTAPSTTPPNPGTEPGRDAAEATSVVTRWVQTYHQRRLDQPTWTRRLTPLSSPSVVRSLARTDRDQVPDARARTVTPRVMSSTYGEFDVALTDGTRLFVTVVLDVPGWVVSAAGRAA